MTLNPKIIARVSSDIANTHWRSLRMWALTPVLLLFIVGMAWGLSDPKTKLTTSIGMETGGDVLYILSAFVLLAGSLGIVLVGFDCISGPRSQGTLAIELAQPVSRPTLALAHLAGVWITVALPVFIFSAISCVIVAARMEVGPNLVDVFAFLGASMFMLLWWSSIQLLASSISRDGGSAVAIGIGAWLVFTTLWVLVTLVIAGLLGAEISGQSDIKFSEVNAYVDLLSPNGVYQLLIQTRASGTGALPIGIHWVFSAALAWTILPIIFVIRRFRILRP